MNTKSKFAITLLAAALAATAYAQQPAVPGGGVAVASEPGKAAVVGAVEISAQVVAIDKATRTVTLEGAEGQCRRHRRGRAGQELRPDQGRRSRRRALCAGADARTPEDPGRGGEAVVKEEAAKAKPGEKPAVAGARTVTLLADVIAVDPKASTITLKGPKGNEVTLDVHNPEQFKVVKKGDQVEVTYTEALALSVEPAPKSAAAAKK